MKTNNYKLKNTRSNKKRLLLLASLLLVTLLAGGFFAFNILGNSDDKQANDTPQATTEGSPDTIKTTPEDKQSTAKQESAKFVPTEDKAKVYDYVLVTENETFKIRRLDKEYYVTLYAIINRPDQSDMYRDQLRQYKQDALNYLTKQGVDINTTRIKYEPEEAASL